MNANTFASFSQSYPSTHPFALPATFTTTSSTETAFLWTNGAQAFISVPKGTEILGAQTPFSPNANSALSRESGRSAAWFGENRPFFNSGSFNNRPFRLRAFGYIAGGGTTLTSVSATINVYAALTNTATVTSGTKIASYGITGGIGNSKANWFTDIGFQWDSVSGTLSGVQGFTQFGAVTTLAGGGAVTTVASANLTSLNFGLTWTFATTSTSNSVGLVELSLEQV